MWGKPLTLKITYSCYSPPHAGNPNTTYNQQKQTQNRFNNGGALCRYDRLTGYLWALLWHILHGWHTGWHLPRGLSNSIQLLPTVPQPHGTSKHRLYLPHSWAISHTNHAMGHLQMRSSVLFYNWWILWRATIPSWYFQGFFMTPFLVNYLWRVFLPTVGLMWLAGSALGVLEGSSSTTILASCHIGDDQGDNPTSSSLPTSSLLLNSSGEGSVLCACAPGWGPLFCPALSVTFVLAILEWKSNQSEIVMGFFLRHTWSIISRVTDSPY